MTASPQPGNQDERLRERLAALADDLDRLFRSAHEGEERGSAAYDRALELGMGYRRASLRIRDVLNGGEGSLFYGALPWLRPAAAAAGQTGAGEEADKSPFDLTAACQPVERNPQSVRRFVAEPAPSAGQDTGQMRDELAEWLFDFTMRRDGKDLRWAGVLGVTDDGGTELLSEATVRAAWRSEVDHLLDGPLRQLIAERDDLRRELDQARGQVQRVREVLAFLDECAEIHRAQGGATSHRPIAQRLRRALGGDS